MGENPYSKKTAAVTMKKLALILFILPLFAFLLGSAFPVFGLSFTQPVEYIGPPDKVGSCVVGGCSGELCVESGKGPMESICIWKEEFACYSGAQCERQSSGNCGWTMTDELKKCLNNGGDTVKPPIYPSPIVYPIPTVKPNACGNGVCESGEADFSDCPVCDTGYMCPMRPCFFRPGSCPADCPKPPSPTTRPVPSYKPIVSPQPPPPGCTLACPDGYVTQECRCGQYPSTLPTTSNYPGFQKPRSIPFNEMPLPTSIPETNEITPESFPSNQTPFLLRPFFAVRSWFQSFRLERLPFFNLFTTR